MGHEGLWLEWGAATILWAGKSVAVIQGMGDRCGSTIRDQEQVQQHLELARGLAAVLEKLGGLAAVLERGLLQQEKVSRVHIIVDYDSVCTYSLRKRLRLMGRLSCLTQDAFTRGSSWRAFSTVAAEKGTNQIVTGHLISPFKQELIDCDPSFNNRNNGGLVSNGLHKEDNNPELIEEGTCE
ncbi:hypothetical protein HHK36_031171 [Tetracentron sinense]|uniref:Peptidase C1A papain C-terminal domain-containing protein n=1 Tax=Tetracentron sinense TaxID=13715 RepID=A0A835D1F6_TETSI|nr:hypothetical protein HHK36_031171 [Tetracentron sinense]